MDVRTGTDLPASRTVGGLVVTGGSVLVDGERSPVPGTVRCRGHHITSVDGSADADRSGPDPSAGPAGDADGHSLRLDATGCWVLPGLIDLHGDAFERSLQPRPGVDVDVDLALADNDRQLLAAGITTSYLSATDSWEPGLRSRETLRLLIDALGRRRGGPQVLLHVRHERCNVADVDELERWVRDRVVRFLSFGDHTPGGIVHTGSLSAGQIQRSGVGAEELQRRLDHAVKRRHVGADQELALAEAARRAGCPTASHDPSSPDDLLRDLRLGVRMAEFPLTVELARRYRDNGIAVLLGAPNLVRGRSHLGNLSVADAIGAGVCDVLCSDYHYPSLLQGAWPSGPAGADAARWWGRASSAAAEVAGLSDRGRIAPGQRADLVVVEPPSGPDGQEGPARVRAVVVAGELVHLAR